MEKCNGGRINMETFLEILHTFPHAIAAGLMIAVVCAFLGVFVVLKRLVFIGAVLSETATCGIAAALFFHADPVLGAVVLTMAVVTLLAFYGEEVRVPRDSVLALIFILTSSLAIVLVSKSAFGLDEVKSLLYGDLILTSPQDLKILFWAIAPPALVVLLFLRPVVYTFADRDQARVLGIRTRFWELLFYYALGVVISTSSKLGGMVLIFCHLVISPMAGLIAADCLAGALGFSVVSAVLSTLAGFYASYWADLPANQVIAIASCLWLALTVLVKRAFGLYLRLVPRSK